MSKWRNRDIGLMDGGYIRIGPLLEWAVQHPDGITLQVESSDPEAMKHAAGLNVPDSSRDVVTHVQHRGLGLWRTLHVRWVNWVQRAFGIKMRSACTPPED